MGIDTGIRFIWIGNLSLKDQSIRSDEPKHWKTGGENLIKLCSIFSHDEIIVYATEEEVDSLYGSN